MASEASNHASPGPQKRIRLSLACNACRKRKVRCDAETPKCRNCWLRGDVCETTDPRKPEVAAVRRWATKDGLLPNQISQSHQDQEGKLASQQSSTAEHSGSFSTPPGPAALNPHLSHAHPTQRLISWATRAYKDAKEPEAEAAREAPEAEVNSPDMVVMTDSSSHRVKYMGGSSMQCLCVFVDLYLARKGLPPVSTKFKDGMPHVEEFQLPLTLELPNLPPPEILNRYVRTFISKIWPLFPIIDPSALESHIKYLSDLQASSPEGLISVIPRTKIPVLSAVYSIICIASDEQQDAITEVGTKYITAAYYLYSHLISVPYLESIQAMVLFCLALRGRGKEGQAWHILGHAIRAAHSVGLHKHVTVRSDNPTGVSLGYRANPQLHSRIWWSMYALEKLMELETGRPSAITDHDCDQLMPGKENFMGSETTGPDYFAMFVSLARIMSQISEHIYRRVSSSASQLLYETGRLDQALQEWASSIPEGLKPGHEIFSDDDQNIYHQHIASFLSLQFYQAQITLLRASLIFPMHSFVEEVKKCGTKLPNHLRLLQSYSLCIGASRAIVKHVLEMADNNIHSTIITTTQTFLAAIVLALSILKNPQKRMVRSDMQLLVTATEYAEDSWKRAGQSVEFIQGCELLRGRVQHVYSTTPKEHRPSMSVAQEYNPSTNMEIEETPGGFMEQLMPTMPPDGLFDPLNGVPLEELWTMLGSDFTFGDSEVDNQLFP
ncbi:hypothetical protein GQ53DRAFT_888768 [Thozetella sp. PMI_491]|nr:hypothetical protein GQ53DRAFT_888768 [Thozetella sp. PMI_491]